MNEVYFIYSKQDLDNRKSMVKESGAKFKPGTVIVQGKVMNYTEKVNNLDSSMLRSDAKVVAKGNLENIIYTEPSIETY